MTVVVEWCKFRFPKVLGASTMQNMGQNCLLLARRVHLKVWLLQEKKGRIEGYGLYNDLGSGVTLEKVIS